MEGHLMWSVENLLEINIPPPPDWLNAFPNISNGVFAPRLEWCRHPCLFYTATYGKRFCVYAALFNAVFFCWRQLLKTRRSAIAERPRCRVR